MWFWSNEWFFDFALTSATVLVWFFLIRGTIKQQTEKKLSWILTLLSSFVCSIGCLPLVWHGFQTGFPSDVMYNNDRLTRGMLNFFCCYLLWDTAFIPLFYPSVGGYHHHLPYFLFMSTALYYKAPGMFVVFMPMELSSVLLAVGHIWPSFRQDLAFGITFFLGRIVYHSILWTRLFATRADSPFFVYPFALLPLCVHVNWFYKWSLSYIKKNKIKGSERRKSNWNQFNVAFFNRCSLLWKDWYWNYSDRCFILVHKTRRNKSCDGFSDFAMEFWVNVFLSLELWGV